MRILELPGLTTQRSAASAEAKKFGDPSCVLMVVPSSMRCVGRVVSLLKKVRPWGQRVPVAGGKTSAVATSNPVESSTRMWSPEWFGYGDGGLLKGKE